MKLKWRIIHVFSLTIGFSFTINLLQGQSFQLIGQIRNAENQQVYLIESDGSPFYLENQPFKIIASAIVKNEKFVFKGKLNEPANVSLKLKNGRQYSFILEPGVTYLKTDANTLWTTSITNSKENQLYFDLWRSYHWAADSLNHYSDSYYSKIAKNEKDAALKDSINYLYYKKLYDSLRIKKTEEFIFGNPKSFVSLSQLNLFVNEFGPSKSKGLLSVLVPYFKNHTLFNTINEKIHSLDNRILPGSSFPNLTIPDVNNKPVSIGNNKAPITIIDFWASWCMPCRKENKIYQKIYHEFKGKGVNIISISLDNNRQNWIKAISTDKMVWINVSDLKGVSSQIPNKLGITSLPSNFILDKEGKVIAINISGEELYNKIKILTE